MPRPAALLALSALLLSLASCSAADPGLFADPQLQHPLAGADGEEAAIAAQFDVQGVFDLVGARLGEGEPYIVQLRDDIDSDQLDAHIAWLTSKLGVTLPNGRLMHKYDFGNGKFHGYAGTLHPLVVQLLRTLPVVKRVERDAKVYLQQITTTESKMAQAGAPWNLARAWQRGASPPALPSTYQYWSRGGRGADVYVLDTGISSTPQDYAGRVVQGVNYTPDASIADATGHGSHVAGIIAGRTYGVAKNTTAISVKVLDASGQGSWSQIIAGINWAVSRANATARPSVINMSIAGSVSTTLNSAIKSAVDAGLHVVVAAGNAGADACNVSPASAVKVAPIHVVGAVNARGNLTSWSNWGPCVTILAPGESIQSVNATSATGSTWMSGTSMAAPAVSGILASILAQVTMRPDRLARYVRNTATKGVAVTAWRGPMTSDVAWLNATRISASDVIAWSA